VGLQIGHPDTQHCGMNYGGGRNARETSLSARSRKTHYPEPTFFSQKSSGIHANKEMYEERPGLSNENPIYFVGCGRRPDPETPAWTKTGQAGPKTIYELQE